LARQLMKNAEWKFFESFIIGIRGRGGRPASNHRQVLDGIFWIARTGAQWRDLPEEFGKWSSVYRQFRRWTVAGLWELILDTLNDSEVMPDQVQMIPSRRCCASPAGLRIVQLSERTIRQRAQKGDSETGFWPFKRWLHDENSPDCQRAWSTNEGGDQWR